MPKLVARCAVTTRSLSSSRRKMLDSLVTRSLPRQDLIHYFEFVQCDETPLHTRIVGDAAPAAALGSIVLDRSGPCRKGLRPKALCATLVPARLWQCRRPRVFRIWRKRSMKLFFSSGLGISWFVLSAERLHGCPWWGTRRRQRSKLSSSACRLPRKVQKLSPA